MMSMSGKEQMQRDHKRTFQLTEVSLWDRKEYKQQENGSFLDDQTEVKEECAAQGQEMVEQTSISAVNGAKTRQRLKIGGLYFEIRGLPEHMQMSAFAPFEAEDQEKSNICCESIVSKKLPDLFGAELCGRLPGALVYRRGAKEYRFFGAGLCREPGAAVHAEACLELDSSRFGAAVHVGDCPESDDRPSGTAVRVGAGLKSDVRPLTEKMAVRLWITPQVTQLNLAGMMGFERLILPYDRLVLHASCVDFHGQGILFSAPSGTGKTTQARLWKKYAEAQILNEDRALLYIPEEPAPVMVYGSPYTGSSRLVSNRETPVAAIILLEQGSETELRPAGRREAFLRLYRELTVNTWDRAFVERAATLLERLITRVPVWGLRCRPDEEAVRAVENLLTDERFHHRLSEGLMV